ncbi:unnamed protein product [Camellia sinensis]
MSRSLCIKIYGLRFGDLPYEALRSFLMLVNVQPFGFHEDAIQFFKRQFVNGSGISEDKTDFGHHGQHSIEELMQLLQ